MRRLARSLLAARGRLPAGLTTLALLALAMTSPPGTAAASPAPPTLDGSAWTLAALPGRTLLPDRPATLRFEGTRAAGTDGCNRYSATYAHERGRFHFGQVVQTQMACPDEAGKQAQAFMAALGSARAVRHEADRLQLLDAAGVVLATLGPQSGELAGTSWQVSGYNNGRQAVVSVIGGTALTLEFAAEGRVGGSAGCNRFNGSFTQSQQDLSIIRPATTRRLCTTPAGIMEQEQAFLAALQSATRVRLDGDRLELRTAGDQLAISATRSTAGSAAADPRPAATAAAAAAAPPMPGATQTFAADMIYFADAARVTLCREGRSLPLAMEADYLKMERRYTATAKPPGAPLHVTFEGAILERPKMEGPGTEPTMVVTRFIHAWPGETCERARADASLANTYWRIARFDAGDVKGAEGRREPHLLLRSPAKDGLTGDYSATVGCNTLRGSYRVAGESITFTAGAATRMACPPPLDALERQLGALLARSARWQVTANTLELLDADGASLGALQAIYF